MKRAILFAEWVSMNSWHKSNVSRNYMRLKSLVPKKEWQHKTPEQLYLIAESEGVFKELKDELSLLAEIKAMTEHLTQEERNEYFDLKIKELKEGE